MNTKLSLVAAVLLLTAFGPAQNMEITNTDQGGSRPPSAPARLPIPVMLKKTVAVLSGTLVEDGKAKVLRGTGFFVFMEDKRLGSGNGFVYLVTNRHVAAPEVSGRRVRFTTMSVRLNQRDSSHGSSAVDVPLPVDEGAQFKWHFPSDEAVDLAVMQVAPDISVADYLPFPIDLFATEDVIAAEEIAEGDPVLFTGFFYQYPGQKKMQPIVRQGILAMMPDEPLTTTLGKLGRVYLADAHAFGGNSGAPIFVDVTGRRHGALMYYGGFPYRLLGVVSGYYPETSDLQLQAATTLTGVVNSNSGISVVVPADELKKLLESPELVKARDEEVVRLLKLRN